MSRQRSAPPWRVRSWRTTGLVVLLVACVRRSSLRSSIGAPFPPANATDVAVWTQIGPRGTPTSITDIAALSHGEAVLLAQGTMVRWNGVDDPTPVCVSQMPQPLMIEADGDRFVALGGDEGTATVWVSGDRGASCTRVTLPPLRVPRSSPGRLGLSLDGNVAIAWSTGGAVARSDDGGLTWLRLPDLAGIVRADKGPDGSTLGASTIDDGLGSNAVGRAVLVRSRRNETRWEPIPGATPIRLPLVFDTLSDASIRVVDQLGAMSLPSDGSVPVHTDDPGRFAPSDRPRILQRSGPGRIVGFTSRLLISIEDAIARPFAALPDLHEPHCLDASEDGTVWVSDGENILRGATGSPLTNLTSRPFEGHTPRLIAANGNLIAVETEGNRVFDTNDGGRHWNARRLPTELGEPTAMCIDPASGPLVLGRYALGAFDGTEYVLIRLPARDLLDPAAPASITVTGSRWIVTDGSVRTSDDRGATWTVRLGPSGASSDVPTVVSLSMHGSVGVALQTDGTIVRTEDGATSFHRIQTVESTVGEAASGHISIGWDGDGAIALVGPAGVDRLNNPEGTLAHDPHWLIPWFSTRLGRGGVLVASSDPLSMAACGDLDPAPVLMVDQPGARWSLATGACIHRGKVMATDDEHLYLVDASGSLWSASLHALADGAP